ncbi:MAG: hypothetical protein CEE40_03950 [Chloroflexi bacterium B3_Chlor]|nr:MAG: hypothetical protein CEE40_03950 [Chloroflexi bacterium B3_Chlor]
MVQALILAGGEGRRMSDITAHVPKPLLYLPGGTLLEYQLAQLAQLGISHTFVVIHHEAEQIERALHGLEGVTLVRQRPPLTLLGALASAEAHVTELCLVLHSDNYFSNGLGYLLREAQNTPSGFNATFLVESRTHPQNKARRLASTGCYVLSPEVLSATSTLKHADGLWHLTARLLESGAMVREVRLQGWRSNINHLTDLLNASRRILEDWSERFHPSRAAAGYNRTEGCRNAELPLWISSDSQVTDSDLGPNVVVGPKARVNGCELREVIVFPGAGIVGQRVEGGVVVPTKTGSLVLTSQEQMHGRQKSHSQEEPAELPPTADQEPHPSQEKRCKGDDLHQAIGGSFQASD